jgi:hypothetical protein
MGLSAEHGPILAGPSDTSVVLRLAPGLVLAALLLAGCGGGAKKAAQWPGPPPPAADGSVAVAGFDQAARSPLDTAAAFLRLDRQQAATTTLVAATAAEGGDRATVTATFDGLLDDSVRASRYVLTLEKQTDGTWRLRSAMFSERCRPGRGHQAFSSAPCV